MNFKGDKHFFGGDKCVISWEGNDSVIIITSSKRSTI